MTKLVLMMAFACAQAPEPYSETFTKITGIEPGAYRLVKGPDDCIEGDLEFRDKVSKVDKTTPGIAFVLNTHPLAGFLGGKDEGGERGATYTSESTVTASRVDYVKTGTYKGKTEKWTLVLTPRRDGFTYVTEIKGKRVTCELAR